MDYSILKYGCPMLTDIEDLEQAKTEGLPFVVSSKSDYIEIRDADNETVTIGYFDGRRFHWTKDKLQAEAWKSQVFVSKQGICERGYSKVERSMRNGGDNGKGKSTGR